MAILDGSSVAYAEVDVEDVDDDDDDREDSERRVRW